MRADDFAYLARMLQRRSGLVLGQPKRHQIENRLAPVIRRFGLKDIAALVDELRHGREALARAVTETMTTNESSFFRDRASFEQFHNAVLPELIRARKKTKRLRIWSAACSAGQEPYSIAMLLNEMNLQQEGWHIDIVATDISAEIIERAAQGLYSHFEVQRGLPIRHLVENFVQEGSNWRVSEHLRRMVTFRSFNLLDSFGWLDDIDAVFCRNVLMYFDQRTKADVLDKMAEVLAPDGYLMLGSVETTQGLSYEFEPANEMAGVYRKSRRASLRALTA